MSNDQEDLAEQLKKAGLPADPCDLIDRLFRFTGRFGNKTSVLTGRVVGFNNVHDRLSFDRLELHVSSTRFNGSPLLALQFSSGTWQARVGHNNDSGFEGELELLR